MNRQEYGKWLKDNAVGLSASIPVVFNPDDLELEEHEQEAFLRGARFGLEYAAMLASKDHADEEWVTMAINAQRALAIIKGSLN